MRGTGSTALWTEAFCYQAPALQAFPHCPQKCLSINLEQWFSLHSHSFMSLSVKTVNECATLMFFHCLLWKAPCSLDLLEEWCYINKDGSVFFVAIIQRSPNGADDLNPLSFEVDIQLWIHTSWLVPNSIMGKNATLNLDNLELRGNLGLDKILDPNYKLISS